MMRIAIVITQLEPGGAQRVALALAAELRARGYTVRTWFLYQKIAAFPGETGISIVRTQRPQTVAELLRMFGAFRRALTAYRPDAILTYTHYANVIGGIAGWLGHVPRRIASQHNPGQSYPRIARVADLVCGTAGVYTANVAVSDSVRQSFSRYPKRYRQAMRVIYNGLGPLPDGPSHREARARMGIPDGRFVAAAVGRLAEQKNHALLIEALSLAPAATLLIAGEGHLRGSLEAHARKAGVADRVRFLGAIDSSGVVDLLRAADVFAMPSWFEGLSLALIEALRVGLPILASDVPAQREALTAEDGTICGMLLRADDPHAWADAFTALDAAPDMRATLAERAHMRVAAFTAAKMADQYEELLRAPAGRDQP